MSFTVEEGTIVGFLGPNGAGKTTTMNIITGYLSATSGEVTVSGKNILEEPNEVKKLIGYLPELPPLYMDMTVKEYLNFMYDLKKVKLPRQKHIQEICELVQISNVYHRLIGNLSKGYKQRVGIAQALLGNPPVLILDEPTVGLDPKQIIEIRTLIKNLGRNHTVILSSHILPEVQAVCERIIVVNKGRLVADGATDTLAHDLSQDHRLILRAEGPEREMVHEIQTLPHVVEVYSLGEKEKGVFELSVESEPDADIRRDLFDHLQTLPLPFFDAQRKGKSRKARLKIAIDAAIPQAKDFDDFLRLMQAQGYEIKPGKFVSFRAPGQERFTRCKTLGENYTEEAITRRIKGLAVDRGPKRKATKEITLRIDLENSIKAQQSAGYVRWAKVHNLKQAARTLNFLTEHGIDDYAALESKVAEISAANDEAAAALKAVERRLSDMAVLIKNISTYRQTRPVALEYKKAKDKAAYRREHESQLILYEAAAKAIKDAGVTKLPNLAALKAEYRKLDEEKERLYQKYGEVKKDGIIKQNVDSILRVTPHQERTQEL